MNKLLLTICLSALSVLGKAQVIYTDINPDTVVITTGQQQMASCFINFDGAGPYEKEIRYFNPGGGVQPAVELANNIQVTVECPVALVAAGGRAKVINAGDTLSATSQIWGYDAGGLRSNWYGAEHFVGMRFKKAGQWYYGWVRIEIPTNVSSVTVKDYAYNTTPDEQIVVGVPASTGVIHVPKMGMKVEVQRRAIHIDVPVHMEGFKAALTDMNGRVVKQQQTLQHTGTIGTEDLVQGIYILTVLQKGESRSFKIAVQ